MNVGVFPDAGVRKTTMKPLWARSLGLGLSACLGCSSSGDGKKVGTMVSPGPDTGGGAKMSGGNKAPAPGEAPTITPLAPTGADGSFGSPEFPEVFGANFGGTDFPSSTCRQ